MIQQEIRLERPERFEGKYEIAGEKLDRAIERALDKLEKNIPAWTDQFARTHPIDHRYVPGPNNNWECGMQTGTYWLAYELSGNPKFRQVAEAHLPSYRERFEQKIRIGGHDVGFVYTPSCVAAYKITGDEEIRKMTLDVAEFFYNNAYLKERGFVMRSGNKAVTDEKKGCRTMMDTLMNVPLLFWAGQETGDEKFTEAGLAQSKTTQKYLIREDASSFHHYQFEPYTWKPMRGRTLQGNSDDSCWSRGHSWGVYGFPIAYSYTKAEFLPELHKNITYFMLNHLPEDLIPYWDYDFIDGDEPRDSSAGVIAVCGMNEMCKYLPDSAPQKAIFKTASAKMLEAVIDHCAGDIGVEHDGLIGHVTHAKPQGQGIDQCGIYGDYFYLEALMRFTNPDWNRYW